MAKNFYADPYRACIYQGADNVILSPIARLQDVFFHSDFKYFQEVLSGTNIISLPAYTGTNTTYTSSYTISIPIVTFSNTGYIPISWFTATGQPIVPFQRLLFGGDNVQTLNVTSDSTGLYANVYYQAYQTQTIPASTLNISYLVGVVA